jgi:hypothetical protein
MTFWFKLVAAVAAVAAANTFIELSSIRVHRRLLF